MNFSSLHKFHIKVSLLLTLSVLAYICMFTAFKNKPGEITFLARIICFILYSFPIIKIYRFAEHSTNYRNRMIATTSLSILGAGVLFAEATRFFPQVPWNNFLLKLPLEPANNIIISTYGVVLGYNAILIIPFCTLTDQLKLRRQGIQTDLSPFTCYFGLSVLFLLGIIFIVMPVFVGINLLIRHIAS